jgi:hypothetical protein
LLISVKLFATYPQDVIFNAVFDSVTKTLKVTSSGSSSVSGSTVCVVITGSQIKIPVSLQEQTFTLMVVDTTTVSAIENLKNLLKGTTFHLDSAVDAIQSGDWYIKSGTVTVANFPTEFPLPSSQSGLLSRPTVHIDAPIDINNFPGDYPDDTVATLLAAGTTTYEKNPAKLYEGQTIYKSSGTAGKLTSASGITITITDKVTNYSFLYESPTSEYCKIEPSHMGVPTYLNDGKFTNPKVDYPQAITFTISDMVVGSTLTWVIPTVK